MNTKNKRLFTLCFASAVLAAMGSGQAEEAVAAEVVVLSTLHQMHENVERYSFDDLAIVIEQLHPDILAVELTPADLEGRREQRVKQEYQRSVFPLVDKHNYDVIALEPSQPRFDEIVQLFRQAQQTLSEEQPEQAELFGLYVTSLYNFLNDYWKSPETVNSRVTDMFFDAKHRFQNTVFGPQEAQAWEAWNQYFLSQIVNKAKASPNKRIVVLVGAEHSYWLRAHLEDSDVELIDTVSALKSFKH
jgi:pheromone shutdown protein TraB